MFAVHRIRLSRAFACVRAGGVARNGLAALLITLCSTYVSAQTTGPTYQISSAVYTEANGVTGAFVPAGVNGAELLLTGTLPSAAQQAAAPLQACFYTGYGSTSGISLSTPNDDGSEPLTVPASTIQSIPQASFTAANGYQIPAKVYLTPGGQACDGTFDSSFTNQFTIPVVAPALVANVGAANVPQTNPGTSVQAAPTNLLLSVTGLLPDARTNGSTVTLSFGSFGSIPATILPSLAVSVPVPAAFASSPAGTVAALGFCFTASGGNAVCTTPLSAINITVTALVASAGTVVASPDPVLASGMTTLTAQFQKSAGALQGATPGAPSGLVSFVADGTTLPSSPLVLDKTATFSTQSSTVTTPSAATPIITPAGGSFTTAQVITLTDTTAGASIYYTQDGSAPTTGSTLYIAPFTISTTETINAIAVAPGSLMSAVATAAYTITLSPPTQLAFSVQPVTTAINTAITPAVQVAVEDANGMVVTSATNAVTMVLRNNPGKSQLDGTKTVNAVNGIATFSDLTLGNVGNNYTIAATSTGLTSALSNAFNITPYPITMTVQSALIGIGSTLNGNFTLAHAAPDGGVTVSLTSSTPANVTIAPATVAVAAGQTAGTFTYTGVAGGNSTLSASAPNYLTGTVAVTGTSAQVSLAAIPNVAPGQMVSLALSLPTAAPPGGTTVTFKSSDTTIATVTQTIFVPAGQFTAASNPQVNGIAFGNATIIASAPGYAPATRPVTVTVMASFNPNQTNLNLITSTNTTLNINAPAPAGGITFNLTSDDPTIATIASPVTIAKGATKIPVSITGKMDGNTTIRADATGVAEATGTVNVNSTIQVPTQTTGVKLEYYFYVNLPVAPSVPTTVTVTATNSGIATLSLAAGTTGTRTVTFTNVTSSGVGYVYLQGQVAGTTTVTVSAPGYTTGSAIMTVQPTGFTYYYGYQQNFSTTTYSSPTNLTLYTTTLDTNGNVYYIGLPLNPNIASVSVPVTSSDTTVGTIVTSPVVFAAQAGSATTSFQPAAVGTTNLTIGRPPAPFSVSTQYPTETATVTMPDIGQSNASTGVNLENSQALYLPVSPPKGVTVTVTSNSPNTVKISNSATTPGGSQLTFTGVTGTYIGTIYLQGVSTTGSPATLTIAAPGYITGTDTITVFAGGFSYYYGYQSSFTTTTNAGTTGLNIYPVSLDANLNPNQTLLVSPLFGTANVPVTSSSTTVGSITTSPVSFTPGVTSGVTTYFKPATAGTTNLTVGTPTGFTTPSADITSVATVTAPSRALSFGNDVTTGAKLESSSAVYLSSTPTGPVNVTVTSGSPTIATVSNAPGTVGTPSTTFTGVTSTYVGTVYVQGQVQGSTMLTATATDYTSSTNNVTVDPSGFTYSYYNTLNPTTTTFSSPSGINVYSQALDPTSLAVINYPLNLNPNVGPISVNVTSSAPAVGTITTSPVMIAAQNDYASTSFQPVSAGNSNVTLSTPAGFSTPSNDNTIAFTVTAPQIQVSNVETGLKLENSMYIQLPQTPPNPVDVTVTSNGPQIVVISTDGTVVGGTTVVFKGVTSGNVGYVYFQGKSIGGTTFTVSAPGYLNGTANATVDPSGFVFYYPSSFTTSATSGPTNFDVYPASLNAGTNTLITLGLELAPGYGNVSVPVTSGNTGIGTITTSPVVFMPGVSSVETGFQPVATGMTTVTVGTPSGYTTPSQYTQYQVTVQ